MCLEELPFEVVPSAFGADRQEDSALAMNILASLAHAGVCHRVGHEPKPLSRKGREFVFDQGTQRFVDGDERQMGVLRLCEAIEQPRAAIFRIELMRVEIIPLDPRCIAEHQATYTELCERGIKPADDLGPGQGKEDIDAWHGGDFTPCAVKRHALGRELANLGGSDRSIDDAHPNAASDRDTKDLLEVSSAMIIERDATF